MGGGRVALAAVDEIVGGEGGSGAGCGVARGGTGGDFSGACGWVVVSGDCCGFGAASVGCVAGGRPAWCRGSYRAVAAQECADRDRGRPNERVLVENKRLHEAVRDGLADKWSPRQVSRRLPEQFPGDQTLRVSHEAIYQTLYLQARGELRTQLSLALRPGPGPAGEPVPGGGQGEHRGHGEHQRTAGGSRGPGGARVLGRGSDHRAGWAQPDRDAGRGGGAPGT